MNKYNVDIQALKDKEQAHSFVIDSAFFSLFQPTYLDKGSLTAEILLNRGVNMIKLHLEIHGQVELVCDRSLRPFEHAIHTSKDIVFKLGDRYEEMSEDVIMIDSKSGSIDVSQLIYDYIALEVPMKKLHPDYDEENEEAEVLIWTSQNETSSLESEDSKSELIDPRWSKLKSLNSK